jgi:F-type H+-transporting ATPase subunit epsilon
MKLKLQVVTPERIVFEDEVDSISAMTEMGEITILPNHIPIVANLKAGEMRLKKGSEQSFLAASTGFLEVRPGNHVVILADTAERMEELELDKIEKAKEAALKLLEETRQIDNVQFAAAAAAMERELARYKVAIKRKHRGTLPKQQN